ncbi:glycosyltransferase [Pantoea allii]|uniref:glycosyltransferase n=1 Tax=Pantoea allii TaxID=574096 RepID=UPI0024B793C0|nr:glycosyltransferase [Pantoea allii]MDJ0037554.1 glycosyltransferase [Pantoea allii]
MKAIHLINLDKMGGAEKVFLQFISNSTCENIIFCISNDVDESIMQALSGHEISYVNRMCSFAKIKFPPFIRPFVLKYRIEREAADVLVVWDLIPRLPGKAHDIKTIYYDHGSSWTFPDNRHTRAFLDNIDAAIAPSEASKAMMQKRLSVRATTEIIPNTLPEIKQKSLVKEPPTKEQLILGTASRLTGVKGIAISILTVAELLYRGINAKLLIAGKGPEEADLRQLVNAKNLEENVDFLGYQEDLTSFYNNIHFYMSTSFAESFGLSCLNAQIHGVPCIYSIVDGQPEVNIDGVTGTGIIPTVSIQDYISQIGYQADIEREHVYDPVNKVITSPKAVSYQQCADVIEEILQKNNYSTFLEGLQKHNLINNNKPMTGVIDDFLSRMVFS